MIKPEFTKVVLGKIENIDNAFYYTMDGTELEHVFEEKDLGVWVDHQLTFDEHISLKVKKANSMAGLIRRNFTYLDARSFKTLYVTFYILYFYASISIRLKKF